MALKLKKIKIKEFLKDLFEVEIEFISALSVSNGFSVPMSSLNSIYVRGGGFFCAIYVKGRGAENSKHSETECSYAVPKSDCKASPHRGSARVPAMPGSAWPARGSQRAAPSTAPRWLPDLAAAGPVRPAAAPAPREPQNPLRRVRSEPGVC